MFSLREYGAGFLTDGDDVDCSTLFGAICAMDEWEIRRYCDFNGIDFETAHLTPETIYQHAIAIDCVSLDSDVSLSPCHYVTVRVEPAND